MTAEPVDDAAPARFEGGVQRARAGFEPTAAAFHTRVFAQAMPGMSGAETLLALAVSAGENADVPLTRLIAMMSATPAAIFGVPGGNLGVGAPADIVLFDPGAPWRVDASKFVWAGGNTPFDGLPVQGRVKWTVKGGEIAFAG